jgi:hypothetical protein
LIDEVIPVVPDTERDTVPEKWFKGVIVMLDDPLLPTLISAFAPFTEIA